MRKYLIIILAAVALLWLLSIVVYHEVLFQYISGLFGAFWALLLYIFIYGLIIYCFIRMLR